MDNSTVGIVGAGAMGNGIAQVAAQAGHTVKVYDNSAVSLDKAKQKMSQTLNMLVDKGKISLDESKLVLGRLEYTSDLDAMQDATLIIEAIIEKIEIKKELFRKVEEIVSDSCILATNTSSLSVTEIAAACEHCDRVIGLHFFNPAPVMRLVEVIPALQSDIDVVSRAKSWMQDWGKTAVIAKDTPGFIVNRVARPYYSEALRIYDEGLATKEEIDATMTQHAGFRMGPFTLMDFIGHDVNFTVTETAYKSFYQEPRYKPSLSQKKLVEAGWLGKKTGQGFYNYEKGSTPLLEVAEERAEWIADRIITMLINEAYDALYYGVASAEDLDLAMTQGVNYPKGLIAWGEELGKPLVISRINKLYDQYQEDRYRVSQGLKN